MLDVHPPHTATHTWRDFLIHIATICVGLLIAIALEQTVEAVNRRHERVELRAALDKESRQVLSDTEQVRQSEAVRLAWLRTASNQVAEGLREHHAVGPMPPAESSIVNIPNEPIFKAAKTTGKLALLSDDDVIAYGELDSLLTEANVRYEHVIEANRANGRVLSEAALGESDLDQLMSHASPDQLKRIYLSLVDAYVANREYLDWCSQAHAVAMLLLQGERDMQKFLQAEMDTLHQR